MNLSINDIIAYEEQKKKQQEALERERQREYVQVSYDERKPEIQREQPEKEESACQVIITTL
ncbi:MAG: hypothetical protein CFH43_00069 [Proteobacteria bacterium]|nr:MAG: hypothetical protein CFH43_00069 [Pseudomonadota bacterium]